MKQNFVMHANNPPGFMKYLMYLPTSAWFTYHIRMDNDSAECPPPQAHAGYLETVGKEGPFVLQLTWFGEQQNRIQQAGGNAGENSVPRPYLLTLVNTLEIKKKHGSTWYALTPICQNAFWKFLLSNSHGVYIT